MIRRVLVAAFSFGAGISVLVGCGSGSTEPAANSTSAVMRTSDDAESTTDRASSTSTESPSVSTPVAAESGDESSDSTKSDGPIVARGKQSLTLADARPNSDWKEGSYSLPQGEEPVKAIATKIDCYSNGRVLEFRFAKQNGLFKVEVAQDLNAESSAVVLEVGLYADGRSIDVKKVSFDQTATLSTPLSGVSAIKVIVKPLKDSSSSSSDCETTALLKSIQVEQN